jgi:hypothetical protein
VATFEGLLLALLSLADAVVEASFLSLGWLEKLSLAMRDISSSF